MMTLYSYFIDIINVNGGNDLSESINTSKE